MHKEEEHKVKRDEPRKDETALAERVGKLEAQVAALCKAVGVSG